MLAKGHLWREEPELPACIREALEARRRDGSPEIASYAESVLADRD